MESAYGTALLLALATVGIVQGANQLRLNFNSIITHYSGRLETYYSDEWIPFTMDGFNMHAADLACKSLGYKYASRCARVGTLGFSQATTTYSIYDVICPLTTSSFDSCTYSRSTNKPHYYDVGLECTNSRSSLRLLSSSGDTGGPSGRLQIYVNNTWGTVCDDNFGSLEAGIACRQLGFTRYSYYDNAGNSSQYSSYISGPIWLENLNQCNSSSTDLRSCTRAVGVHDCSHSEDLVITCYQPTNIATTSYVQNVRLRLVYYYEISTTSYGRLEIYYSNEWIPFTINGFDMHAADLACQSLGYSYASRYGRVGLFGYSEASTTFSAYNVGCLITASTFDSCSLSTTSYYSHAYDVGLQCTNARSSLRLLSSSGDTGGPSGRLQIYVNGTWGTVCDDNFGSLEAGIACRQLGFTSYNTYHSAGDLSQYSSSISGPIWLDYLNQCSSSSTDLRSCTSAVGVHGCTHSEDIVLTCFSPTIFTISSYSNKDLRLNQYGDTSTILSSGRLEVYYRSSSTGSTYSWVPFCLSGFSSYAADLACKQLGYGKASFYGTVASRGYPQSTSNYSISAVTCYSYYSELRHCTFYKNDATCSYDNDVAISCSNNVSATVVAISVVVVFLVLCSCVFIGVTFCVVVFVVCNKKTSTNRTVNVAQNSSAYNYRMSNVTEHENSTTAASAPRYSPSLFTPIMVPQDNANSQNPPSYFTPIMVPQENANSQNPPSYCTPIIVPQDNANSQNPPSYFTPIMVPQENANSQNPPSYCTPIVENANSQNPPNPFTPIVVPQENANSQNQSITETATVQEEDNDSIEDADENKPLIA